MNLKVGLVVGDRHSNHCGVKDYAITLGDELLRRGLNAKVIAPADWGARSLIRFQREVNRRFDLLHVHYPSIGNRKSLGPHLLGSIERAAAVVVTLHEYSALPTLQRASTHLFAWTADYLLFTTASEREKYGHRGVARRVIPIASSVPEVDVRHPREPVVLYFGQIRPNKGLEGFIDVARLDIESGTVRKYQIIGTVPPRRTDYYERLKAMAPPEVEWLIDLSFTQVAERMARSMVAYLPFPDGASDRRSSLLAALTNGLPVISTLGEGTSPDMKSVLLPSQGPIDALAALNRLQQSPALAKAVGDASRTLAANFSWARIGEQHEQVYRAALSGRTCRAPVSP